MNKQGITDFIKVKLKDDNQGVGSNALRYQWEAGIPQGASLQLPPCEWPVAAAFRARASPCTAVWRRHRWRRRRSPSDGCALVPGAFPAAAAAAARHGPTRFTSSFLER